MFRAAVIATLLTSHLAATAGCSISSLLRATGPEEANPNDDNYRGEGAADEQPEYRACGRIAFYFRSVQIGGDSWGPPEYRPPTGRQRVDCDSVPEEDDFAEELASGVAEYRKRNSDDGDGPIVWDGKYEMKTDETDLRLYRFANLYHYSRKHTFQSPCGEKDPKLTCEADSTQSRNSYLALLHNELTYNLERADVRRKAGHADLCKKLLGYAVSKYDNMIELYEGLEKENDGSWVSGMTYRISGGKKLSEDELVAKIKSGGKRAKKRVKANWCAKEE
jgi:hypothetical protein